MSEIVIISAVLIGLSLGIFGSGGAILTLPTLIYFLGLDEKQAVIGSLFIVLLIATVSLIPHLKNRAISFSHIIYFASPGLLTSYAGGIAGTFVDSQVQIIVFILLMIIAAFKMLFMTSQTDEQKKGRFSLIVAGAIVGFMTGFVGVGGGFLIVPALMMLGGLNIKVASSTSLAIICLQSTMGLVSYLQYSYGIAMELPWSTLGVIAGIGVVGSLSGIKLRQHLNDKVLTQVFGIFLVVMAIFIGFDKFA